MSRKQKEKEKEKDRIERQRPKERRETERRKRRKRKEEKWLDGWMLPTNSTSKYTIPKIYPGMLLAALSLE